MSIETKLLSIQTKIKCAKTLYNSFGKYNYRNFESICESVKPFLEQEKCILTVSDEMVLVGDRVYVKATATLIDCENCMEKVSVTAFARESENKKGMDDSQVTGTASSYARKYAVNGLFLLDDTKDADTDEYAREQNKQPQRSQPTQPPLSKDDLAKFEEMKNAVIQWEATGLLSEKMLEQMADAVNKFDIKRLEAYLKYARELEEKAHKSA